MTAGDVITFYMALSNTGGVSLPANLRVPSILQGALTCTLGTLPVSPSTTLNPGAMMRCNATYMVQQDDLMRDELFVNVSASAAPAGICLDKYVWVTMHPRAQLIVEFDTYNCTLPSQAGAPSKFNSCECRRGVLSGVYSLGVDLWRTCCLCGGTHAASY